MQEKQPQTGGALHHPMLDVKEELIKVLALEASSIQSLISNFPENAEQLVAKIIATKGKVILTGSGKSGHVGRKLTATFASLGTPSMFLHPHEALHGDLGMVQPQDLVIILSKSGSGTEFELLLSFLKTQNNDCVLICCDKGPLSSKVDFVVYLPFSREACTLNLAPTSSSTLMMAFGDALAVATSKARSFSKNDFARFHPAGSLGKKLLLSVKNFMHVASALPLLPPTASFQELLSTMNEKKLGVGIIVDKDKKLLGIVTDGDIRRLCKRLETKLFKKNAQDIMTQTTKVISQDMFAGDALAYMEDFNITALIVTHEDKVIGLVHIHDIVKAGLKG